MLRGLQAEHLLGPLFRCFRGLWPWLKRLIDGAVSFHATNQPHRARYGVCAVQMRSLHSVNVDVNEAESDLAVAQ